MIADDEACVLEVVRQCGPLAAFRRLIGQSDAAIRGAELGNGRAIVTARTAIYTALVGQWAQAQQRAFGYDKPFAVVALGGTGRAEVTPCSDLDFAFLFEGAIEGNAFLLELQRQILHTDEFREQHGFGFEPLPFGLDDVPSLAEKQLNSFLDMRAVFDPCGLAQRFRERIRATYDPFEHFLHLRGFWKEHWESAAAGSERLDRFDIKNDGLRVFLGGIWTLAGKTFCHSHEVYRSLEDARDLEAYDFLLRIRAWVHLRRPRGRAAPSGNHPEDILRFEDSVSYGEMLGAGSDEGTRFEFADEVRSRVLSARRRVAVFARAVIERELAHGRAVAPASPVIYGTGGLRHATSGQCHSERDKSRAALALLLAAQRYGVAIDPSELHATFRNAGDWLVRVPEISALFYEPRGSLADSFEFLSQLDGAEERLFPGYGKFESSLDARVMREQQSLRGALERQKMRTFERYVAVGTERLTSAVSPEKITTSPEGATPEIQAALLDPDHRAAVKLALKTKRLPLTPDDEAARADVTRPLHERHASGFSGIPLADYFAPYAAECEFAPDTVEVARFLVENRRAFKEMALVGVNDAERAAAFARRCGDEQRLRALFVFTCADRAQWESAHAEPVRWFNIRELYGKAMTTFHPRTDGSGSLAAAGFGGDELVILRDIGEDCFSGSYRLHAIRFGAHLVRLAGEGDTAGPKAAILRDGTATMLGVAARDYRGLAASISGALWHSQVELQQAHLFSATFHGLALDFFHLTGGDAALLQTLPAIVEEAIRTRRHIAEADEAALPRIEGRFRLTEARPGLCCLSFETRSKSSGLIYALTYKTFRYLEGNIFALSAHRAREETYISIHHSLPRGRSLEEAREIVAARFASAEG
jgi:hypothetical protein